MKDDKSTSNDSESNDVTEKIEIFSTSDDKIKYLGEMFSNDSSRKILVLLIRKEMTTSEISRKTELSLSLVIHHLNKMMNTGIVNITRTSKNSKGQEMKHYRAKRAIVILPAEASEKAKKSKTLSNSLKKILKFTAIGIAGLISWQLLPKMSSISDETIQPHTISKFALEDPNLIVIPLIVIILGLIIERIVASHKHKKKL